MIKIRAMRGMHEGAQNISVRLRPVEDSKMLPRKKSQTSEEAEKTNFTCSDDEIELLLQVVMHYQSNKEMDGVDWESVKAKYADLRENFIERYPTEDSASDFPHHNDPAAFTKERLVSKVKPIRQKYKVALDSGRRSGGGRVVAQFYDICSKI